MIIKSNTLGWKIDKTSKGFIIRKGGSMRSVAPSIAGLVAGACFLGYCAFRGKIIAATLGVLVMLYLAYYTWNARLFLNTKKRLVMDGSYRHRFKFRNVGYAIEESGNLHRLILLDEATSEGHVVWESTDEAEVLEIAQFLTSTTGENSEAPADGEP